MRNTLAGCSRMRVGEGSPKKKEIEKMRKHFKNTFRNGSRKSDGKGMEKPPKSDPKMIKKLRKYHQQINANKASLSKTIASFCLLAS